MGSGRPRTSEKCSHCGEGERYRGGSWCLDCRRQYGKEYGRMRVGLREIETRDYGAEMSGRGVRKLAAMEADVLLLAKRGEDYHDALSDLISATDDFLGVKIKYAK